VGVGPEAYYRGTRGTLQSHSDVRGCAQKHGVEYDEFWAPMPAEATVRAFLALAAAEEKSILCTVIKTAYLDALLDKDVYVAQPERFTVGDEGKACHILRAVF